MSDARNSSDDLALEARHGFVNVFWGSWRWRTVCACRQSFDDDDWHVHAHEYGADPHGRHFDGLPCPCDQTCELVHVETGTVPPSK